ncbi:hypothetical protein [Paenibacillus wenxiniae]|uniref:Phage tail protein n=1 Tax=Paenibacillus wenxiniae TaxID=1636843 RepID=A0ABW4RI13_9BACL
MKAKLAELIPEWQGKVLDIPIATTSLSGSCAVITFAEEVQKSSWAGYRRIVKVWPYAAPTAGGMEQVEAWCDVLIRKLHQTRLVDDTGAAFTCVYLGAADSDHLDLTGTLLTRPIRFGVYVPEPAGEEATTLVNSSTATITAASSSIEPADPWLQALNRWTHEQLGEEWTLYNDAWPSGYVAPSILWRLTGVSSAAVGTSTFELRKQWIGHVYGMSEQQNKRIAAELVERLNAVVKLPLHTEERRYVTVGEASADVQADAFLNGQIRLTLFRRTSRDLPNAPLMREVHQNPVLDE